MDKMYMYACIIDGTIMGNNDSDDDLVVAYESESYVMPPRSRYYQCDITRLSSSLSSICDRTYQLIIMDPVCVILYQSSLAYVIQHL